MTDRDRIDALVERYSAAYAAADAGAVARTFAEDAHLYTPFAPPAFGRPAIAETHAEWFLEGERDKIMRVIEARSAGDIGEALVGFAATVDGEDGCPARLYGMSLNTLQRDTTGGWLIRHCCLNMLDTPPDGFPS